MTKDQIFDLIKNITEHFEVPFPEISYTWRGKRGNANFSTTNGKLNRTWLNLPRASWTGIQQLTVHETSHLVHFKRMNYQTIERAHGPEFTKILIEVAAFVKELTGFEYNFSIEYPEVASAAGVTVMPYGIARKRIGAINAIRLALPNLTGEQIQEMIQKMENGK